MKVYLNSIVGIDDAVVALHMSKRSWRPDLDTEIRKTVRTFIDPEKGYIPKPIVREILEENFNSYMEKLLKYGVKHTTLLRFIDMSSTVEGLHRAGQDDWDSHAKRFENRIVRASTRLSVFSNGEKSDFYKGKIKYPLEVLEDLGIEIPDSYTDDNGTEWTKTEFGYVDDNYYWNKDVRRGLYPLAIPSNFIFRVNRTEFAHVYKLRNKDSGANPEVQDCCEMMADLIEKAIPWFNRELFLKIEN